MGKLGGFDDSGLENKARILQERTRAYSEGYTEGQQKGSPEEARFLEHLVESFDYDALLSAFTKVTGMSEEKNIVLNNAILKHFVLRPARKDTAAFYDVFINNMALIEDVKEFKEGLEHFANDKLMGHSLFKIQLLMLHEMAHALSRNRISSKQRNNQRVFLHTQSGFANTTTAFRKSAKNWKSWPKFKEVTKEHEAFNEGVTERIAEEVFWEYAKLKGFGEEAAHFLQEITRRHGENLWLYSIFMNQVDGMCEKIAAYLGRDKDSVWMSFKRGYMLYGPRYLEKSEKLYAKVFGEKFWGGHKILHNDTPLQEIAHHDATHLSRHPKEYAQIWLEHLGIAEKKSPNQE